MDQTIADQQATYLRGLNTDYEERYGFHDADRSTFRAPKGLDEAVIRQISAIKEEPQWMLEARLKAYYHFQTRAMPAWGPSLAGIDFDAISYFVQPLDELTPSVDWEDVPTEMKETFQKLGISEEESKQLAGVTTQYDSMAVYHQMREDLQQQGVIFLDMDSAIREYPDLVKQYLGTVIPANDNKFSSLNSAVMSGGSFVYIPPGVHVDQPLQTYFRINSSQMLQAERTLIIVGEGASGSYMEGCSASSYSAVDSLHAAVVEIIVEDGADFTYYTFQNWSPTNVWNMVTKRAKVGNGGVMRWIQLETGSRINLKYPSVYLLGDEAHGEIISVAFAGAGQNQDTGGKAIHVGRKTSSIITSKSISKDGGIASYRGLLEVAAGASEAKSSVVCDALLLDDKSVSNTWPTIRVSQPDVSIAHEATVSKVGEEQMFYLQSHGISEEGANALIINGFIEPVVKLMPMEYAVEMSRLIELKLEGSIG